MGGIAAGSCTEALVPCVPAVLCVACGADVPEVAAVDEVTVPCVAAVVGCVLPALFAFNIRSTEQITAKQTAKEKINGKNFFIISAPFRFGEFFVYTY